MLNCSAKCWNVWAGMGPSYKPRTDQRHHLVIRTDYSNTGKVALNPEWTNINSSVVSFENERTIFSECTKLHSAWGFAATSASFPVPKGGIITVICQEKYINVGAKIVSCIEQAEYSTAGNKIPTCLKPSKIEKASAFEVVLLQF